MKRVALYVRVSSQEQKLHGLSVDNQIDALQAWCAEHGFSVAGIYNDAGISGRKKYTVRPALLALLDDCKAGLVDLVIFTKLDRWFRSVADYYEVQSVLDSCHVPWRAIWEDYETETSAGVFKVNIMLSVAQAEADRTSERIKSVLDYKRQQGDYVGCVPAGYIRKDGKLYKDETRAREIELMFEAYFNTQSVYKTVAVLDAAGYTTTRSTVTRRLKNKLYAGGDGICEPYISDEQHAQVLRFLADRVREPKNKNIEYMFAGLIRCKYCGCTLDSKAQRNIHADGSVVPCKYYICRGTANIKKHNFQVQISEANLERFLVSNIVSLVDGYNVEVDLKNEAACDMQQIKKLKARLDRVGVRFEVGDLSVDEYKEKRQELLAEIAKAEGSARTLRQVVMPSSWRDMYDELDVMHRRAFWKSIISRVEVSRENKNAPDVFFL